MSGPPPHDPDPRREAGVRRRVKRGDRSGDGEAAQIGERGLRRDSDTLLRSIGQARPVLAPAGAPQDAKQISGSPGHHYDDGRALDDLDLRGANWWSSQRSSATTSGKSSNRQRPAAESP